jgi:spermidine synthase
MSMQTLGPNPPSIDRKKAAWPIWIIACTILLSAFMLFQVQPLISKWILPWYGGAPGVWTSCMLFFQLLLFAGYVYAHLLEKSFSLRGQAMFHLLLVAVACLLLPIIPKPEFKPGGGVDPSWHILLVLTATVGLPYFVLSATSPLVQAWFSRGFPGRSPYRLYAVSNIGSLAALLSYPFFFEWVMNLKDQSLLWSGGFVVYGLLCGMCLLWMWNMREQQGAAVEGTGGLPSARLDKPTVAPGSARQGATAGSSGGARLERTTVAPGEHALAKPSWWIRIVWVVLPACASLMLLATTNHVCQDMAVVPFLWVVPLSLYLLSFIVCFDHPRWYVRDLWCTLAILGIAGVVILDIFYNRKLIYAHQLLVYFSMLFFVCMVCHGELARRIPNPKYLTEFYLVLSAGGALGGLLVSLVAPHLFNFILEWPIGLLLSMIVAVVCMGVACAPATARPVPTFTGVLITALTFSYIVYYQTIDSTALKRMRNFYGVLTVYEENADDPETHYFHLLNGQTTHGVQFADPEKSRVATTYYGQDSGAGQAIRYYNTLMGDRPVRVGAVGLGTGTLATYARKDDEYCIYEINPNVPIIARRYFSYLENCEGDCHIVMGDARLSMERELTAGELGRYHVIVLDAFSSDAIPAHLLTKEAFDIYLPHLASQERDGVDGVIAVHISNRYIYLAPVVRELAKKFGFHMYRVMNDENKKQLVYSSDWILLSKNDKLLAQDWFPDNDAKHQTVLMRGPVIYGNQFADPEKHWMPTAYYSPYSGVGCAMKQFKISHEDTPLRVGVVGMGAGTMAAHAREGDEFRFYEIDPEIPVLAKEKFTYLDNCDGFYEIVSGDPCASLERELDKDLQRFDVLVLDPLVSGPEGKNILARDAFQVYASALAEKGAIAINVTGNSAELMPMIQDRAQEHKFLTVPCYDGGNDALLFYSSDWVVLTKDEDFKEEIEKEVGSQPRKKDDFSVPLWTDQYNNLFQILRGK